MYNHKHTFDRDVFEQEEADSFCRCFIYLEPVRTRKVIRLDEVDKSYITPTV